MIPLRQFWELLREYLAAHRAKVAALAVLMLAAAGLQLLQPVVMARFIDSAVQGAPAGVLTTTALVFLGIAFVAQAIGAAQAYVAEDVGWSTTNALRATVALHCLRLDMPFHLKYTPGQLIERIDGDVAALSGLFSRLVLDAVASVLMITGALVVLATVDLRVAAGFAGLAALGALLLRRMRHLGVPYNRADRQTTTELMGFIQERLAGTEDVRSRGATPYVLRGLWALHRARMLARSKAAAVGMAQWGAIVMLTAAGVALTFSLGGSLYQAGVLSIGTVFLILNYSWRVTQPLSNLTRNLEELQRASASVTRIRELLDQSSALTGAGGALARRGPLGVELDGVSFAYPGSDPGDAGGEPVLHDVSLRVEPGQVLALLGRTGSGKTTIARLLLRLYDPSCGTIRLGGVDLRSVAPRDVRERVSLVTQEVQLFAASVRDNLTFFNRAIDDARVVGALDVLGLERWYRSLPLGLDTPLAADGSGVSAGEAQLLAFARVFLRDPGVVILDEASSRLDPATERRIERAVDVLLGREEGEWGAQPSARTRTGIVIAHRLATAARADSLLILEGGRVVEQGPRAALAADPSSRFASLLRTGLEVVPA